MFVTHVLQKSDTLAGLAVQYNVAVSDIKRANGLMSENMMWVRYVHATHIQPCTQPQHDCSTLANPTLRLMCLCSLLWQHACKRACAQHAAVENAHGKSWASIVVACAEQSY